MVTRETISTKIYTRLDPIANEGEIIFEGTLLAKSEYSGIPCGGLYVHQVAKYRIEKILSGEYQAREIVVDHPACDEDVFQNIPVGSRLRIWVQVREHYSVITLSPGIRDETQIPQVFYVAVVPPEKIGS